MVGLVGMIVALAQAASRSEGAYFFRDDTCTLLDWLMISVTSAIAVTLVYTSIWLFKLSATSSRLTRIRLVVTVISATLAGLGIVFGTTSIMSWVDCFLLVIGDDYIF